VQLSACSTATARNQAVLDEAIHLATAFQLAGFPPMIGTLWPISDDYATLIATAFYDHLRTSDTSTDALLDTGRAAHALHHTIRRLRDDLPILPAIWAAHLHAGA
jgi:CHAT domain-containing protein